MLRKATENHSKNQLVIKFSTLYKTIFLILLCHACLNAQELKEVLNPVNVGDRYFLESLTISDGLYTNRVQDVLQDSYGFLWLAGSSGLQKYDGYTFTFYDLESINPDRGGAKRLFEDSNRNLWIQMTGGLIRYQRESDTFVKFNFVNDTNDTIAYGVTTMAEDMKRNVWFWIYGKGLFKIDSLKNTFVPHMELNAKYEYDLEILVRCMIFDLEDNLWIGPNARGLVKINLQTGITKKYLADPAVPGSLSNNTVTAALLDQNGAIWFATKNGLNRFDSEKELFEKFYIGSSPGLNNVNEFDRMAADGFGNIWLVKKDLSTKGISYFNKKSEQFSHYSNMRKWPNSVTVDRSGIVWFGSAYSGVYKLDPDAKKFSAFSIAEERNDLLKDRIIQAVCKDKNGIIWFGGDLDGLYRFDPNTGQYKIYRLNQTKADRQNSNFILDIFQDSRDILWIGTKSGLIRFNTGTGMFKHIHPDRTIFEGLGRCGTILEDENGILWLTTVNGYLVCFNPESEKTDFFSVPDSKWSFRTFTMDPRGILWIGTLENGLLKFDITDKKFSTVKDLTGENITTLVLDRDSILWCATSGSGLIRYNTNSGTKSIIDETDGLLTNSLLGMERDDSGNLWLSSFRGLTRYNPQMQAFRHFFKEDGFLTNEFVYRSHFKDENGKMIFGSLHGLVTFHPDSIKKSNYKPPIVLTDIKIDNKSLQPGSKSALKKHISISDEVILNHDQNDLSITFASLDFRHPQRNKYSFYLENMEDSWRSPGKERTAFYTNLDPGQYVFKVKGTNSDGIWNEAGISLKITVLPPWWKTTWAFFAYGLLIFAMLYSLRRYELNRQKLKLESEKYREIDHIKSRFFANISHEFRTPLTLIEGPIQQLISGEFTGNIKKQYGMVLSNTKRLKQLINQLLDLSRLDSGKMVLKTSPQNIIPILKGLTHSFESLARQKNINLRFHSGYNEMEVYIDRDKFEKIIINLLSNAFKCTPEGGEVTVNLNTVIPAKAGIQKKEWIPDPHQRTGRQVRDDEESFTPHITKGRMGGVIQITVSNTGPVIPADQLNKIFDRFYQADDSPQRRQEGSGIGLALTKELVELHHGTIDVTSDLDRGTTFTVQLFYGNKHLHPDEIIKKLETADLKPEADIPIPAESMADIEVALYLSPVSNLPPPVSQVRSPIPGLPFPLILIVEDNPDMRRYMISCLENKYRILQAEDGEKGFQYATEKTPDIIISDVMMPGMDGFQFCSKIKTDQRTSHIPVVLLTAKASADSKIEGLETGADDYLTKPFDKKVLMVRLKNLIEQRQRLQEKFRKGLEVRPNDVVVTSIDEKFLQEAIDVVEGHMADTAFDTETLAEEIGMSRRLLYKKLKALTGLSAGEFIRTLRLKRSAQLLRQDHGNVSQVAYEVGFLSLSYFAKAFREFFGESPSQYISRINQSG